MNEKKINQRLLIILGMVLLALFFLLRWDADNGGFTHNLRPGLDIAGGVSMIFEIQEDPENPSDAYLAESLKEQLRRRVDPQGVYDLTWRVLGTNRIEVQMPLPPEDNRTLREAYFEAEDVLRNSRILRDDLEESLNLSGEQRSQRLDALASGSPERLRLLQTTAERWDAYNGLRLMSVDDYRAAHPEAADPEREWRLAVRDALEAVEDAREAVFDTNFPLQRFFDIRDLDVTSQSRRMRLEELKQDFPALAAKIAETIEAYDAWRGRKRFLESASDLQRLIRGAGVLEFRLLVEPNIQDSARYEGYRRQLVDRGPLIPPSADTIWLRIDDPLAFLDISPADLRQLDPRIYEQRRGFIIGRHEENWYVLASAHPDETMLALKTPDAPKWKIVSVGLTRDGSGRQAVGFSFDRIGGSLFGTLTGDNIGRQLCITIDGVAYSAANIQSMIRQQGIIQGEFSLEKLNYLIQTMQAGVLPARLKDTPLSERTIGSSLGAANLRHAFTAAAWGLAAVALVMMVYYQAAGVIATIAMVMNILLVLGALAMLGAQFTLAGIAGVILTIGMTVDANVLIFERMYEERERGSSLRMIIKNGYDKAFSTIIDANITTLITCLIIYRVGSEEIKGFGLTLGWGIVTSLFTSLFVTRTLFMLLIRYNMLKSISGLRIIGTPNIDWYSKRKFFLPVSATIIVVGLSLLFMRGAETLDVEFRGGISADIELRRGAAFEGTPYNDVLLGERLRRAGALIESHGPMLSGATISEARPGILHYSAGELSAERLAAYITEPLEAEGLIEREGVMPLDDGRTVAINLRDVDRRGEVDSVLRVLGGNGNGSVAQAGREIAKARVGQVLDNDTDEDRGRFWNVTTTVTNRALVTQTITDAFGQDLVVQPRISFDFSGDVENLPFPIESRRLEQSVPVLPEGVSGDVTNFQGGAALYFNRLDPPQTLASIQERLRSMRLAPDFEHLPNRDMNVIGVTPAGQAATGEILYSGAVIAVVDDQIDPRRDAAAWRQMAQDEYGLVTAMFNTAQSLQRVTQFKPQVAVRATTQAIMALALSWIMIIGYLWLRFGKPVYGFAGVCALVHDVCIALAFVGISGWLGGSSHPIGYALLIDDFKINMTIVAAFLTIIGYSINDTIVVFDRIRETRGRLGVISPKVINDSINQTLSRTVMTSGTTLLVLLTMYIFGGQSIRGFNYCMIIGIITGTYSSIAIAAPLLMLRGVADRPAVGGRAKAVPA